MIPAAAELVPLWLLVDDVIADGQLLDAGQVGFYVDAMTAASHVVEGHLAPPLVDLDRDGHRYRIRDGRHRHAAHRELGRERIRCIAVVPA